MWKSFLFSVRISLNLGIQTHEVFEWWDVSGKAKRRKAVRRKGEMLSQSELYCPRSKIAQSCLELITPGQVWLCRKNGGVISHSITLPFNAAAWWICFLDLIIDISSHWESLHSVIHVHNQTLGISFTSEFRFYSWIGVSVVVAGGKGLLFLSKLVQFMHH